MNNVDKKKVILGVIAVALLVAIPLTLSQLSKPQTTENHAAAGASLSFTPDSSPTSPIQSSIGSNIDLDMYIDPGTSSVTFVRYQVTYDPTKVKLVSSGPVTLNSATFTSVEGPVMSSVAIAQSVGIGSDPTKVVTQKTKIATLHFIAVGSGTATITFGTLSQALSSGSHDQANENVLSTTSPAVISISGNNTACNQNALMNFQAKMTGNQEELPTNSKGIASVTITGNNNNALTVSMVDAPQNIQLDQINSIDIHSPADVGQTAPVTATIFNAPGNFSVPFNKNPFTVPPDVFTAMIQGKAYINMTTKQYPNGEIRGQLLCSNTTPVPPTTIPIPTVTGTALNFTLLLHGIGSAGDNPNPEGNSLSNKNPLHPQRNLTVQVFDTNNNSVASNTMPVTYDSGSGTFIGAVGLPATLPSGNYSVKIQTNGYLRRLVPGIQQIVSGQATDVSSVQMIAGDTNTDNVLNVLDYNALLDCGYGQLNPLPMNDPNSVFNSHACQVHTPAQDIDTNDDGIINSTDYNLFLRELSVQNGD